MKLQKHSLAGAARFFVAVACTGAALVGPCRAAFAWGAGGHMIVAQIAYERLNPNAKKHADELTALKVNPADTTRWSLNFIDASHWPDDVKRLPGFEYSGDEHYIDFPFSSDGTPLPGGLPKSVNVVSALEKDVKILQESGNLMEQAQALRFIIHYVGDIQQPLHCASRVSADLPNGDEGGNLLHIKFRDADARLSSAKLHAYWDGGINAFPKTRPHFVPPPLAEILPAARLAVQANPENDEAWRVGGPFGYADWARESEKLAESVTYNNLVNGQDVPLQENALLTPEYNQRAAKLCWNRVAWGGYRLAALLNAIWPETH